MHKEIDKSSEIELIRKGDRAFFESIYDNYRDEFIHWANAKFGIEEDVGVDLFQYSMVILYDNVKSGKLTMLTSSLKTYLFGIGKNKAKEHHRNTLRFKTDDLSILGEYLFSQDEMENAPFSREDILKMRKALEMIGDPCKALLKNFYFNEWSMAEIAEQMKYKNTDTVKSKKYKCLTRIREIYSNL